MLPDEVWHRLHPSAKVKPWFIVYQSQINKKLQPWEFEQIKQVCCDNENVLYCVGETKCNMHAIWAMDAECQLKWKNIIPANKKWPEYFSEILLLPGDRVLIWDPEAHVVLIYNKNNGDFIGEIGGIEPADAKIHNLDFYNFTAFAADPDGIFLVLVGRRILRFSDKKTGVFL